MTVTPKQAQRDAAHRALSPVSPKVAALVHALQRELLEDIEATSTIAPPGASVLRDLGAPTSQEYCENGTHGARMVFCRFERGQISLRNWRGDAEHPILNPALWYGTERRQDQSGRDWESSSRAHVIDDFGTLVPAEAA